MELGDVLKYLRGISQALQADIMLDLEDGGEEMAAKISARHRIDDICLDVAAAISHEEKYRE